MNPKGNRTPMIALLMAQLAGVNMDELIDKVVEPKCDVCQREVGSINDLFTIRGQFICGPCVLAKAEANCQSEAQP